VTAVEMEMDEEEGSDDEETDAEEGIEVAMAAVALRTINV
jgi:hypothetical protein